MALTIDRLSVARGGRRVLENVSFSVQPGQALVLRGPNGCGKTTLLRTIAGLQNPLSGQVRCAEDSIAYAGHSDGLKSHLTVAENLRFWAEIFGQSDISAALDRFDLTALSARPAHALSAGQKRRLGLARLLVTDRPIWILDEPTVSLDQTAVALFAAVVRDHLAAGGVALLATHIDLGLKAETLDLTVFKAEPTRVLDGFDQSFDQAFDAPFDEASQ